MCMRLRKSKYAYIHTSYSLYYTVYTNAHVPVYSLTNTLHYAPIYRHIKRKRQTCQDLIDTNTTLDITLIHRKKEVSILEHLIKHSRAKQRKHEEDLEILKKINERNAYVSFTITTHIPKPHHTTPKATAMSSNNTTSNITNPTQETEVITINMNEKLDTEIKAILPLYTRQLAYTLTTLPLHSTVPMSDPGKGHNYDPSDVVVSKMVYNGYTVYDSTDPHRLLLDSTVTLRQINLKDGGAIHVTLTPTRKVTPPEPSKKEVEKEDTSMKYLDSIMTKQQAIVAGLTAEMRYACYEYKMCIKCVVYVV